MSFDRINTTKDRLRNCRYCGKRFMASFQQYYCSKEHAKIGGALANARAFRERYVPKPRYDKVCGMCGKAFQAKYDRALYCSHTCSQKASAKRRRKRQALARRGGEFTCKLCHRAFNYYGFQTPVYCSEDCRTLSRVGQTIPEPGKTAERVAALNSFFQELDGGTFEELE